MRKIVVLVLGLSLLFLVGCKKQNHENKVNVEVHKKAKTLFKPGVPDKLWGTYYRIDLAEVGDDQSYQLKISKNSLTLKLIGGEDYDNTNLSKVSYHKISDDTYIIKGNDYHDEYIKVVLSNEDGEINLSKEFFTDEAEAKRSKGLQNYTVNKPSGYFGLVKDDLLGKSYISDWNSLRYYTFDDHLNNNHLMEMNNQGELHLIKSYRGLHTKINGYLLSGPSDDETLLVPISNTQLRDAKTGETFTLYPKDEYSLRKDLREQLGLAPEKIPYHAPPAKKKTEDIKTYDFADDKDDDYYDTYDDFDLNNGDD